MWTARKSSRLTYGILTELWFDRGHACCLPVIPFFKDATRCSERSTLVIIRENKGRPLSNSLGKEQFRNKYRSDPTLFVNLFAYRSS